MKNRAKCRLCKSIIESMHNSDYVTCKCDEIYVDAGEAFRCGAKNWDNFLRIDDEGNEIIVKVENGVSDNETKEEKPTRPTKKELLKELDLMIENVEKLPSFVLNSPISHYDYLSLMLLLSSIVRTDCVDDK